MADFYQQVRDQGPAPVYLVFGQDEFLVEQAARKVAHILVPAAARAGNLTVCDCREVGMRPVEDFLSSGGLPFVPEQVSVMLIRGMRLWAEKKDKPEKGQEDEPATAGQTPTATSEGKPVSEEALEEDEKRTGKKATPGETWLERACEFGLPAGRTAVIAHVGTPDRQSASFKAVAKVGKVLEVGGLQYPADRVDFIQHRLQTKGLEASLAVTDAILLRVGSDTRLLAAEVEKLAVFLGEKRTVTAADVAAVVAESAEEKIYAVAEAILKADSTGALAALAALAGQGVPAPVLVYALARHFRLLAQAQAVLSAGTVSTQSIRAAYPQFSRKLTKAVLDEMAASLPEDRRQNLAHQHKYVIYRTFGAAANLAPDLPARALAEVLAADLLLKTTMRDEQRVMESLVLRLCLIVQGASTEVPVAI